MKKLAVAVALALTAVSAQAEDGAALFKSKCAACHGADGKGDTPMGKALKVKGLAGTKLSAAEIEKVVAEGKAGTKMVAIKGLTPEQLKAVSAYAKGLK